MGAKLKELVFRIGATEARTCGKHLMQSLPHTTAEIIEWNGDTCVTAAYWVQDRDGFYLKFVADRPLELCAPSAFWAVAKKGQKHLNLHFFNMEDR